MTDSYDPAAWYWITGGQSPRIWSSAARAWVAEGDPSYLAWCEAGGVATSTPSAADVAAALSRVGMPERGPPTAVALRAEYLRRLLALLGAADLAHASFIRADDHVELTALLALAAPSPGELARKAELQARDAAVSELIEAYNAIPDAPPPDDYADDSRWP